MDTRPPIIRVLCLLALAAGIASGGALAACAAPGVSSRGADLDQALLAELNAIRRAHGLAALVVSPALGASAAAHSRDMLVHGYFAHPSSNGTPFWRRIETYYPDTARGRWSVGENLFWSSGRVDAASSLAAWMASPPHRTNILDPSWRQVGIAAESSPDAAGVYDGLAVTVITTDFGVGG